MAKKKIKDEFENFGSNDYGLFKSLITSQYGEESFQDLSELKNPKPNYTGSFKLDIALGIPIPEGRIVEIYGGEGSGKSTAVLEVLGAAQQAGKKVAYLNAERNLNRSLIDGIRTLDPDMKDGDGQNTCTILRGKSGEKSLQIVEKFLAHFTGGVIAVDSVDALVPEAILAGDIGDVTIGKLGKLMSESLRRIVSIAEANDSTVIFVNQVRENPGQMFGNPEVTPGGRALKFYASQRIRFKKPAKNELIVDPDGKKIIGHWIKFYVEKNKTSPPFIEDTIPLIYGKGFWREKEVADLVVDLGLAETGGQGGKQIKLSEEEGWMTRDKFTEKLSFDEDLMKDFSAKIREACEL